MPYPVFDDLISSSDYYPDKVKERLALRTGNPVRDLAWAEEVERINHQEQRLHRRKVTKRHRQHRDLAAVCSVVGLLILGLATLAWWVVVPAAFVLLVVGIWGTQA